MKCISLLVFSFPRAVLNCVMSGYESLNESIFKINENPIIHDRPVNVENLEKFLIFFYLKQTFSKTEAKKKTSDILVNASKQASLSCSADSVNTANCQRS